MCTLEMDLWLSLRRMHTKPVQFQTKLLSYLIQYETQRSRLLDSRGIVIESPWAMRIENFNEILSQMFFLAQFECMKFRLTWGRYQELSKKNWTKWFQTHTLSKWHLRFLARRLHGFFPLSIPTRIYRLMLPHRSLSNCDKYHAQSKAVEVPIGISLLATWKFTMESFDSKCG